jgi:phage terminase large subunit-like protein
VADKKNIQEIEIPYTPRPLQLELHKMLDTYRFNVLVMHRRFGKTVCVINHLLRAAIMNKQKNPRYAYISPSYRQSKSIAWDYLKTFASGIPGTKYHETELRCDLPNGARITLLGSENPSSLRGIYLDGCALDEVSQMPDSDGGSRLHRRNIRPFSCI